MPTLFLHVGPHKTGSTYLQYVFSRQSTALKKQGVEYPAAAREHIYGHHNLAFLLMEHPLFHTNKNKLKRKLELLQHRGNLLLSSENFSRIPMEALPELKQLFPNHAFHVIYVARNGSRFLFSLWQQMIRTGMTLPLDKFDLNAALKFFKYNPLAHEENIRKFQISLKAEVSALDYNSLAAQKTDLTQPISKIIGAQIQPLFEKINESLTIEQIELIRAANQHRHIRQRRFSRTFAGEVCLKMLRVPYWGRQLRESVSQKMNVFCKTMPCEQFLEKGFPPAGLTNTDYGKTFSFIPDRVLLNELNKENIVAWKIIKAIINLS